MDSLNTFHNPLDFFFSAHVVASYIVECTFDYIREYVRLIGHNIFYDMEKDVLRRAIFELCRKIRINKGGVIVKRIVTLILVFSFLVIPVYAESDAEKSFWDALGMNPPETTESYSDYYLSGYQDGYDDGFKAGVESVIKLIYKESEEELIDEDNKKEEPYNTKNSDLKLLSRPKNKTIFRYSVSSDRPHSTLEIETPSGELDYYFVVNNLIDTSKNAKFYLYSNSTIEVNIAPGTYEIYYACGSEWYGLKNLFGDQSKCRKFKDTFTFTEKCGWTVEMSPVSNGNLSSELVDASEFPQ